MTVKEAIEMLRKAPEDAIVKAWDIDADDFAEVSGMIYGGGSGEVLLQTDEEP